MDDKRGPPPEYTAINRSVQYPRYGSYATDQTLIQPSAPTEEFPETSVMSPPPFSSREENEEYQEEQPHLNENSDIFKEDLGQKSVWEAYIIGIPFGLLGGHHFYLGRHVWGILYFFTLGLGLCGYLFDLFRMPFLVKRVNEKSSREEKNLSDAYVLWFPLGLLGFHHYYFGNIKTAVLYTFTLGVFGIGWLLDLFLMPYWKRRANEETLARKKLTDPTINEFDLSSAMMLCFSPLGIFGAHHFYLRRYGYACFHLFTWGMLGLFWVLDWFRVYSLVKRANRAERERKENTARGVYREGSLKTIDDAYFLWFPFGFLGSHHFYLQRPLWALFYIFTLGVCGFGWLIDSCRIPSLVKEFNQNLLDKWAEQDRYHNTVHGYQQPSNQISQQQTIGTESAIENDKPGATAYHFTDGQMNAAVCRPLPIQPPSYEESVDKGYPA